MKEKAFTILAAGALATIAFDAFGQGLSPLFGYARLAPVGLANQSLGVILPEVPKGLAHLLHVFTGMFAYTLGYLWIARPLQQRIMPAMPWVGTAVAYGVVLWVFALYVMAHLVAGNKPFLGWSGITYVALWGHIVFALVAAWVMEARGIVKEPTQAKLAMA